MYLKQLVINGFKSFADRTRIELRPGIVAIVGPNGCGKSNIVDAIRWVLGEQSAKALRGGNMHDVIFSGTDKRKALSFCEVELVFADCEKDLGTAFHEISILRRVSRDDSSEYFLNGKICRLKDIQRLFMDTGVGRVSYSFMVQGQIDQVLSANPAERRALFEEAAGITRYKTQRKEALGKLALVDQNLSRVTDVLDELTRQINTLKRQAAKALRYKRLRHRLTCLDKANQAFLFAEHRNAVTELAREAQTLRERLNTLQDALAQREQTLAESKVRRGELLAKIEEQQQQIFSTRSAKESTENNIKYSDARIRDLDERNLGIEQEIAGMRSRQGELEARIAGGGDEQAKHAGDLSSVENLFRARQDEFEKASNALNATESALAKNREALLLAENEITRSRASVSKLELDLRSSEIRHTELANRIAQTRNEQNALRSRHEEAQAFAEQHRQSQAQIQSEIAAAKEEAKNLLIRFREKQQEITALDRQVARTAAQLTMLKQLQAKFEGFSESAKSILKGEIPEIVPAGTAKTLNALLEIEENVYAGAIELLLESNSGTICLPEGTPITRLIETLNGKNLDAVQISLPELCKNIPGQNDKQNLPEFIVPANRLVKVRDANFENQVRTILDRCYICDDSGQFLQFWRERPDFDFVLIATLNGELIDRRGTLKTPSGQKQTGVSSFRREAEIAALAKLSQAENEKLTEANESAMAIQRQMDENETLVETLRTRAASVAQELSAVSADERNAATALENNIAALEKMTAQLEDLERERERNTQKMSEAKNLLESGESTIGKLKETIAQKENEITTLRGNADAAREAANEIKFELAKKKQQLELIEQEVQNIRSQVSEMQHRIETRENEKRNNQNQRDAYSEQIEKDKAAVLKLQEQLDNGNAVLENIRNDCRNADLAIETLDQSMSAEREEVHKNENTLKDREIKLSEETLLCKNIAEKISGDYQTDITSIDWKRELWRADENFESKINFAELEDGDEENPDGNIEPPSKKHLNVEPGEEDLAAMDSTDWQPLRREIEDLRERLRAFGAINHAAIDEYLEVRERFNFTKKQSDDLWTAKNELTAAIDEINTTSQKLFTETFEQIRKNFAFTFERLFHGGESDLTLVQSDDVLESGIEIVARPPGTKLRSISLLSGGQRTMTAVALLFAIYMVKPSPFCVLDELDAPLDDANVGRFTDIVKEFTKYSQFLVVTHNKKTVSAANMIYGVTMQERGVTQVLSMRFNHDNGKTENATSPELGKGGSFNMAR
ncbi:MAG: chromosome segregation protein SMC [Opitutales bacterium]|nr:chromosome segregation protein SMC [Opitutales bacterium]